jgi:plasmid stabilization system protein ParE
MGYNKLIVKTNAAIEIENVLSYYSKINIRLANTLEKEIRSAFSMILKNPNSFQYRYDPIRIFWLKKFPYGLFYILGDNEIFILAFWHSKEDIASKSKTL